MEDGRGSSGIGSGKSIGMAEGILLPAEAVESNRSRPSARTRESIMWAVGTREKLYRHFDPERCVVVPNRRTWSLSFVRE